MWINVPEATQKLKHPDMDKPADLSGGETVQVAEEIGELLIENYDTITEHNNAK